MSQRPELLLVHGAWHGSWAFGELTPMLTEQGWTVRTVDLGSAGSPAIGLHEDAGAVRCSLEANQVPTIVVGHSYGGYVITEGAAGAANLAGLVYLCAGMPDVGEPVWTDCADPRQVAPWIMVDAAGGLTRALDGESVFYHDCPAELAARSAARLRPQSLTSFMTPVRAAAWHDAPSAYLVCDDDRCLLPEFQEPLAARAGFAGHIAAGHSPFMSQPAAVAQFIQSASTAFRG
jgi:pimeloyl-ACP methyl ester carboxylesterase